MIWGTGLEGEERERGEEREQTCVCPFGLFFSIKHVDIKENGWVGGWERGNVCGLNAFTTQIKAKHTHRQGEEWEGREDERDPHTEQEHRNHNNQKTIRNRDPSEQQTRVAWGHPLLFPVSTSFLLPYPMKGGNVPRHGMGR